MGSRLHLSGAGSVSTPRFGRAIAILGLTVWAWLEAVDGVNWFRHLVGIGALVWLVISLAGQL